MIIKNTKRSVFFTVVFYTLILKQVHAQSLYNICSRITNQRKLVFWHNTAHTNDENIKQKNDTIKAKQKTEHVRNHKIFLIYDLKHILSVCLITSNSSKM